MDQELTHATRAPFVVDSRFYFAHIFPLATTAIEYHEEHSHSNVMEKEDTKLAKWITRQRTCYANAQRDEPDPNLGIIKPYQYELLNSIGFCWNPWEQQFAQNVARLRAYGAEHGHTNVLMKHDDVHLANFVQKWRREYRLFIEGKPCNISEDRLRV